MMFIKLSAIIILLEVTVGQIQNRDWDLAVVVHDEIKLMDTNGTIIEAATHEFNGLKAITYDYNRKQFLVSDVSPDGDTIYTLKMSKETDVVPIIHELPHDIMGLSVDPFEDRLYWTDFLNKSINSISLTDESKEIEVFLQFDIETPQDILVDSCNRMLYWTNSNRKKPSIEASTLDTKNRTVLIDEDLFKPMGIAIDHYMQRIYWVDVQEGIYFQIESLALNGTDRQLFYRGRYQKPFGLAVIGDYIYWSDRTNENVWRKHKSDNKEPTMVRSFDSPPLGLTSRNLGFLGVPDCSKTKVLEKPPDAPVPLIVEEVKERRVNVCFNNGTMTKSGRCVCPLGFLGSRCQIDTCYNQCVHGTCVPTRDTPECKCFYGYTGRRCERNLCENFCLNDGHCSVKDDQAFCSCSRGFYGDHCEIVLSNENLTQSERMSEELFGDSRNRLEDPLFDAVLSVAVVQSIIIIVLVVLHSKKHRRPRIKKRIVVNKNITPLTYTPQQPPTAQCEITIENCCNMNVCETPCFEPPSIRAFVGSEKDEKKMLLVNMEHEDLY